MQIFSEQMREPPVLICSSGLKRAPINTRDWPLDNFLLSLRFSGTQNTEARHKTLKRDVWSLVIQCVQFVSRQLRFSETQNVNHLSTQAHLTDPPSNLPSPSPFP